jgi:hypothetical protein
MRIARDEGDGNRSCVCCSVAAGLHGPGLGPAGQVAWCAPAAASGLLLPMAVEVVPSHAAAVLPPLVLDASLGPVGLTKFAIVRRRL